MSTEATAAAAEGTGQNVVMNEELPSLEVPPVENPDTIKTDADAGMQVEPVMEANAQEENGQKDSTAEQGVKEDADLTVDQDSSEKKPIELKGEEEEEQEEAAMDQKEGIEYDDDEEEEEEDEGDDEGGSSRKRQRRSTSSFAPADFKHEPHRPVEIPPGRGVKLGDIGVIHQNVNKRPSTDPILVSLHKFLLGGPGGCLGKGRTSKNVVKKHILGFSGYLPPKKEEEQQGEGLVDKEQKGEEEEEEVLNEMEEEAEERMISKAEKLSLPLLKSFCDILCLDRKPVQGKVPTKNMLIDRLLDFLAEPSPDGIDAEVASPKKRGRKPKNQTENAMDVDAGEVQVTSPKKRGRPRKQKDDDAEVKVPKKRGRPRKQKEESSPVPSSKEDNAEEESAEDDEEHGEGAKDGKTLTGDVSLDKDLRKFVRSYVFLFHEEKATLENAMELAHEKFGSKLDDGKKEILSMLLSKAMGKPKKK